MGDNGGIRLTTARYYTPNNRSIQAAGIQPDIVITENIPDDLKGRDEILGEAGLNGQIGGGTEETATTGSSVYVPPDKKDDTLAQDSSLNRDLQMANRDSAAQPTLSDVPADPTSNTSRPSGATTAYSSDTCFCPGEIGAVTRTVSPARA